MFHIGILVFPMVQQLDLTGPFEVFSTWPEARVDLVWKTTEPLVSSTGLWLRPTIAFEDAPRFDIICVPGGRGVDPLLLDDEVLDFLRAQALAAKFVTSVCTGSLVLGAAGLLRGRRAACHWLSLPLLAAFGARPSSRRIERDGKFITAGGVTSGIDFGLQLAALVAGRAEARRIQLMIQYDPRPPFRSGTPRQAGRAVTNAIVRRQKAFQAQRAALVARAAARLPAPA